MKIEIAKTAARAAWERPALVRMDAADARNAPGAGADRNASLAAVVHAS